VLSFATPAWLLGLLLVPVIRWLHRGGPHRRPVPVASLALWRKAATIGPAAGERRPPDPAWRRRALIAALLSLALAGPHSEVAVERVTLWVDDSLSMLTQEDGTTRLARGLDTAAAELAARPRTRFEVRTLSRPWESRAVLSPEVVARLGAEAGSREPAPPPAGLWAADREHWLITDGTEGRLDERNYARVIRAGEVRRNVGLLRLAARRSLGHRDRLDVELQARNGGDAADERVVVLADAAGELARESLRLAPGLSASLVVSAPLGSRLTARLEPGDALPADDSLALDVRAFAARPVHLDPACPAALVAAVRAHPALAIASGTDASEFSLECGTAGTVAEGPQLRFLRGGTPRGIEGPLLWSSSVGASARRLGSFTWRAADQLAPAGDGDLVLLASGATPLVVRRAGGASPLIETSLDVERGEAEDLAATPLLLAFLVDEVLSASLLDDVVASERDANAVMVVPRAMASKTAATVPTTAARETRGWSRPLLLAALIALLWELASLSGRVRRERREGWAS
jgi:hypothetical protein